MQKMANEKRLIDANILKALFDVRYDTAFIQERTRENKEQWNGYCTGINWGRNTIADAPTVDAAEVVHGRWEDGVCTACNFDIRDMIDGDSEFRNWVWECVPYCPNCGAKMDGGNGDGN